MPDESEKVEKIFDQLIYWVKLAVRVIEVAVGLALVVIILLGLLYLIINIINAACPALALNPKEIHSLLDIALVIFLTIELFRITAAYIAEEKVMPTVLEAAFVAVARKLVLYEFPVQGLTGAISLTILLIAVAVAYFVLSGKSWFRSKE